MNLFEIGLENTLFTIYEIRVKIPQQGVAIFT